MRDRRGIREQVAALRCTLISLHGGQLELFDGDNEQRCSVVDSVREKFGYHAVHSGAGGDTTTTTSMGGAGGTALSTGGSGGSGGAGGSNVPPWAHNCDNTGVGVDKGVGTILLLDKSCPESWGSGYYDGPTIHEFNAGIMLTGTVVIQACGVGGDPAQQVSAVVGGSGSYALDWGEYREGISSWNLASGTLLLTNVGEVGEVVEGSYSAAFGDPNGQLLNLSGTVRVCQVPALNAP